jgi:hypothetical protein
MGPRIADAFRRYNEGMILPSLILALNASAGSLLCEKACMAAYDAKTVGCKTVQSSRKGCLSDAKAERKTCEADCRAKAKAKKK